MKQVFLNLLLNAQDAMPQGGTFTLVTRNSRRQEVVVQVSDTGMGIPKEKFSQIFEPFFTTKKAVAGAGLGLSVVYGIIRDHKGLSKLTALWAKGPRLLSVCLPINREKKMLPHKKINILVVDDELSIRESLSGWLKQDGYEVETAADGLDGLGQDPGKPLRYHAH